MYMSEQDYITADVFGTPGQLQRGVDILAKRRGGEGVAVGQCKCVIPGALRPALLQQASEDFLEHLTYWQERNVQRFILFVAPDTSRTQIQEERLRQIDAFKEFGIEYELWGQAKIVSKLRSQPGITASYLGTAWRDILCGTVVSGFPRDSTIVDRVLRTQIEILAGHVSSAASADIEALREAWRCGKRAEVSAGVRQLKESSRWKAFPSLLQATILRFESQLALDADDIANAKRLADEATAFDPDASVRLHSLIARAEDRRDHALELLVNATDDESTMLRAALLMEAGQVSTALSLLDGAAGNAEAHRLRALGFVLTRDLPRARLEIEKAIELGPDWHATLYTKVIVHYLSGLSPAVLSSQVPQWPQPEAWHFIKTDDKSRAYFSSAVETVSRMENNAELEPEERRVIEAWHIAGLANDPERRDEATVYCSDALDRDPGHFRMIAWALARRLEVDLTPVRVTLQERCGKPQAVIPDVIVLLALYAQSGDLELALDLLRTKASFFAKADADELRRFWEIQLEALRGEVPAPPVDAATDSPTAEAALIALRARAGATGDNEPLIEELRLRAEGGDDAASFELCNVQASLERWHEALPVARTLPERVRTAEAVALSCITLYNAKQYEECLQTLDTHRDIFPHAEFPNDMRRLRLAAQRELGLLPAAAIAAEDLFRREPTTVHYRLLSDLYFEKGDFPSLVVLARKHEQFPDLTTSDLLCLSMRVSVEDRGVATALWRHASESGLADPEVTVALELGYKLGLDREVGPLLKRLSALASNPESRVRWINLDGVRDLLTARRDNVERAIQMYRTGEIPVHIIAEQLGRPLVAWYRPHWLFERESRRTMAAPVFFRHGWRVGMSVALDRQAEIRLHADLTALLMAYQLDVLEIIEGEFCPIMLPHFTAIALAEMRDVVRPIQPARRDALCLVRDLVTKRRIQLIDLGSVSSPNVTTPGLDARRARLLDHVVDSGSLHVDFLPMTNESSEPVQLTSEYEVVLRSAHCVVESLHAYGEITEGERIGALEALGPEHAAPVDRAILKGAALFCTGGVLELLANGGALVHATRVFGVRVANDDFERAIQEPLTELEVEDGESARLTGLIDHISRGIDKGAYLLLPDLCDEHQLQTTASDESASLKCLLDLLTFRPRAGDVIWADDRWLTGFAHRDGAPVAGTMDLLHLVRDRGRLSEADFYSAIDRLRKGDYRFISLDTNEIKFHVRAAGVKDGDVVETRELRTLRRQYAATLADGSALRIAPGDKGGALEWPFVLASGSAAVNAVVEIWKDVAPREVVQARAEWILRNLYAPDRGRSFTQVERSEELDHRMEAVALGGLLCHAISFPVDSASRAISFPVDSASRETRRAYFEWIFRRLLRRRFEADPMLKKSAIDAFKELLIGTLDASESAKKDRDLAMAFIRELLVDLPGEFRATLAEDGDFLGRFGVSLAPVVHLGPHEIKAQELWATAARVLATNEPAMFDAKGQELKVLVLEEQGERRVVVEDATARVRYVVLPDAVDILSDSASAREAGLRRVSALFDLRASGVDRAIARVAALAGAGARVAELTRLQNHSAHYLYVELSRKLRQHAPVAETELFPLSVDAVVRHLRLDDCMSGSLDERLERAAKTLIVEVGLEDTIVRMAGLPISLPTAVVNAVGELTPIDRRSLLKRLIRGVGQSPLGSAHVARLLVRYAEDNRSYIRYAHMSMRRQIVASESVRCAAWIQVLRVCANEFSYVEEFRMLPVDIRLCISWTHADRVFRILMSVGVDPDWTEKHFRGLSTRLPSELAFADDGYYTDMASPRRVVPLHIALAGCGYAFDDGALLSESFRAMVSGFVRSDPTRRLSVMRDLTLSSNVLNCILSRDGRPGWLSVLTDELREQVRAEVLRSHVTAAAQAIRSGTAGHTEWGLMCTVVDDDPVADEQSEHVREGLRILDLCAVHQENRRAALLAAVWSAQHASDCGGDVLSHVRSQLVALVAARSGETPQSGRDNVDSSEEMMLLSAALYLYGRLDPSEGRGRFAEIGELIDNITECSPTLVDQSHQLIERLVDGLPSRESRWLWQIQVKLRAAR